jgi:hypothetical protein
VIAASRATALVLPLAVALAPANAVAQGASASLAVGSVLVRYVDAPSTSALTVSPALVVRTPEAYLALLTSAARLESGDWSPQGTLVISTFTPVTVSGFSGEIGLSAGGSGHSAGIATGGGGANARLHWTGSSVGAWLGGSAGTTWTGAEWLGFRSGELGGVLYTESSTLTLRATPTRTADNVHFTDLQATTDGAVGPLDLSLSLGTRLGASNVPLADDTRRWGSVSVALWVAARVAVVGAAGLYPADLTEGFPAGRYVSLSVRLGGWRAPRLADAATARAVRREAAAAGIERLEARRVDTARIELRVLAPGASMVELMGDATQWQVRALRAAPGGWWTIQIEAAIATELVLRVDGGAWTVPPGTGVVTDEFGGRVGRLVVP